MITDKYRINDQPAMISFQPAWILDKMKAKVGNDNPIRSASAVRLQAVRFSCLWILDKTKVKIDNDNVPKPLCQCIFERFSSLAEPVTESVGGTHPEATYRPSPRVLNGETAGGDQENNENKPWERTHRGRPATDE